MALVGTIASLLLTAALGAAFGAAAHLSGLASDEAVNLLAFAPDLDFRGLLLAATIIGALGVLDDVTITQVSAVWELHHSDPGSEPAGSTRPGSASVATTSHPPSTLWCSPTQQRRCRHCCCSPSRA